MNIPEGYQTVMPYIIVKGADKFSEFMQKVLGGKEKMRHMRHENCIMHAEVMVGTSTIMFADTTETIEERTAGMFVYVENAVEAYQKALDEGARGGLAG